MVGANRIISIDIVKKDKNSLHVLNISFGKIVQNIQIFITNKNSFNLSQHKGHNDFKSTYTTTFQ